jgi:serine/threonine protein kinase
MAKDSKGKSSKSEGGFFGGLLNRLRPKSPDKFATDIVIGNESDAQVIAQNMFVAMKDHSKQRGKKTDNVMTLHFDDENQVRRMAAHLESRGHTIAVDFEQKAIDIKKVPKDELKGLTFGKDSSGKLTIEGKRQADSMKVSSMVIALNEAINPQNQALPESLETRTFPPRSVDTGRQPGVREFFRSVRGKPALRTENSEAAAISAALSRTGPEKISDFDKLDANAKIAASQNIAKNILLKQTMEFDTENDLNRVKKFCEEKGIKVEVEQSARLNVKLKIIELPVGMAWDKQADLAQELRNKMSSTVAATPVPPPADAPPILAQVTLDIEQELTQSNILTVLNDMNTRFKDQSSKGVGSVNFKPKNKKDFDLLTTELQEKGIISFFANTDTFTLNAEIQNTQTVADNIKMALAPRAADAPPPLSPRDVAPPPPPSDVVVPPPGIAFRYSSKGKDAAVANLVQMIKNGQGKIKFETQQQRDEVVAELKAWNITCEAKDPANPAILSFKDVPNTAKDSPDLLKQNLVNVFSKMTPPPRPAGSPPQSTRGPLPPLPTVSGVAAPVPTTAPSVGSAPNPLILDPSVLEPNEKAIAFVKEQKDLPGIESKDKKDWSFILQELETGGMNTVSDVLEKSELEGISPEIMEILETFAKEKEGYVVETKPLPAAQPFPGYVSMPKVEGQPAQAPGGSIPPEYTGPEARKMPLPPPKKDTVAGENREPGRPIAASAVAPAPAPKPEKKSFLSRILPGIFGKKEKAAAPVVAAAAQAREPASSSPAAERPAASPTISPTATMPAAPIAAPEGAPLPPAPAPVAAPAQERPLKTVRPPAPETSNKPIKRREGHGVKTMPKFLGKTVPDQILGYADKKKEKQLQEPSKEEVALGKRYLIDFKSKDADKVFKAVKDYMQAHPEVGKLKKGVHNLEIGGEWVQIHLDHSFVNIPTPGKPVNVYAVANRKFYGGEDFGVLGQGAYGRVKLIQDEYGNNSAIKIEKKKYSPEELESRKKELEITETVGFTKGQHVGEIAADKKTETADQKIRTVMVKREGEELFNGIYQEPLTPDALIYDPTVRDKKTEAEGFRVVEKKIIALKCCQIIQDLHNRGVIHGDIKPANFMISKKGNMIVISSIDFGFSFKLDLKTGQKEIIHDGIPQGTNKVYMAGELTQNENKAIFSKASDIYSLGIMLRDDLGLPKEIVEGMLKDNPEDRSKLPDVIRSIANNLQQDVDPEVKKVAASVLEGVRQMDEDIGPQSKPTLVAQIMSGYRDPVESHTDPIPSYYNMNTYKKLAGMILSIKPPKGFDKTNTEHFFNELVDAYNALTSDAQKDVFKHNMALFLEQLVLENRTNPQILASINEQVKNLPDELKGKLNNCVTQSEALIAKETKISVEPSKDEDVFKGIKQRQEHLAKATGKNSESYAEEVAAKLKSIQIGFLNRMGPDEYHDNRQTKLTTSGPATKDMISFFNNLSGMVVIDILSAGDTKQQIKVFEFYIKLAEESYAMGDFQSHLAIVSGLNRSEIVRLDFLKKDEKTQEKLEKFQEQIDQSLNHKAYKMEFETRMADQSKQDQILIPKYSIISAVVEKFDSGAAKTRTIKVNGEEKTKASETFLLQVSDSLEYIQEMRQRILRAGQLKNEDNQDFVAMVGLSSNFDSFENDRYSRSYLIKPRDKETDGSYGESVDTKRFMVNSIELLRNKSLMDIANLVSSDNSNAYQYYEQILLCVEVKLADAKKAYDEAVALPEDNAEKQAKIQKAKQEYNYAILISNDKIITAIRGSFDSQLNNGSLDKNTKKQISKSKKDFEGIVNELSKEYSDNNKIMTEKEMAKGAAVDSFSVAPEDSLTLYSTEGETPKVGDNPPATLAELREALRTHSPGLQPTGTAADPDFTKALDDAIALVPKTEQQLQQRVRYNASDSKYTDRIKDVRDQIAAFEPNAEGKVVVDFEKEEVNLILFKSVCQKAGISISSAGNTVTLEGKLDKDKLQDAQIDEVVEEYKKAEKISRLVQEVYMTENTYLGSAKIFFNEPGMPKLIQTFRQISLKGDAKSHQDAFIKFLDVYKDTMDTSEALEGCLKPLLEYLQRKNKGNLTPQDKDFDPEKYSAEVLEPAFQAHLEKLKIAIQGYPACLDAISFLRHDPKSESALTLQVMNETLGRSMQDSFITTVQRPPRYVLFAKEFKYLEYIGFPSVEVFDQTAKLANAELTADQDKKLLKEATEALDQGTKVKASNKKEGITASDYDIAFSSIYSNIAIFLSQKGNPVTFSDNQLKTILENLANLQRKRQDFLDERIATPLIATSFIDQTKMKDVVGQLVSLGCSVQLNALKDKIEEHDKGIKVTPLPEKLRNRERLSNVLSSLKTLKDTTGTVINQDESKEFIEYLKGELNRANVRSRKKNNKEFIVLAKDVFGAELVERWISEVDTSLTQSKRKTHETAADRSSAIFTSSAPSAPVRAGALLPELKEGSDDKAKGLWAMEYIKTLLGKPVDKNFTISKEDYLKINSSEKFGNVKKAIEITNNSLPLESQFELSADFENYGKALNYQIPDDVLNLNFARVREQVEAICNKYIEQNKNLTKEQVDELLILTAHASLGIGDKDKFEKLGGSLSEYMVKDPAFRDYFLAIDLSKLVADVAASAVVAPVGASTMPVAQASAAAQSKFPDREPPKAPVRSAAEPTVAKPAVGSPTSSTNPTAVRRVLPAGPLPARPDSAAAPSGSTQVLPPNPSSPVQPRPVVGSSTSTPAPKKQQPPIPVAQASAVPEFNVPNYPPPKAPAPVGTAVPNPAPSGSPSADAAARSASSSMSSTGVPRVRPTGPLPPTPVRSAVPKPPPSGSTQVLPPNPSSPVQPRPSAASADAASRPLPKPGVSFRPSIMQTDVTPVAFRVDGRSVLSSLEKASDAEVTKKTGSPITQVEFTPKSAQPNSGSCVATVKPAEGRNPASTIYSVKKAPAGEEDKLLEFLVKKAFDVHFSGPDASKPLIITVTKDMGEDKQQKMIDLIKTEAQRRINLPDSTVTPDSFQVKKAGDIPRVPLELEAKKSLSSRPSGK